MYRILCLLFVVITLLGCSQPCTCPPTDLAVAESEPLIFQEMRSYLLSAVETGYREYELYAEGTATILDQPAWWIAWGNSDGSIIGVAYPAESGYFALFPLENVSGLAGDWMLVNGEIPSTGDESFVFTYCMLPHPASPLNAENRFELLFETFKRDALRLHLLTAPLKVTHIYGSEDP